MTTRDVHDNAKRLYEDALLLFNNERYRSATSLAILSLEEAGKACLIKWRQEEYISRDITPDIRQGHIDKQRIVAAFLFVEGVLEGAKEYYTPETMPQDIKDPKGFSSPEEFFKYLWKTLWNPNNKDFKDYIRKMAYDRSHKTYFHMVSGITDYIKQAGFYVDIDESLNVVAPQGFPTRSDAEVALKEAELALSMLDRADMFHKLMAVVYEAGGREGAHWRRVLRAYLEGRLQGM